ncbi:MAG: glycosyl hydrolase family 5 [Acidobacteria bacterium]|nr:glycosyl hydrolase family 5 [Acidobacteriota bacterium]
MQRRSFLKSLGAAAAASSLPSPIHALTGRSQAPPPTTQRIFLNQLGYLPNSAKLATVLAQAAATSASANATPSFRVHAHGTSTVALEGQLTPPALDAASGDNVSHADFSTLNIPGTYRLEVAGTLSDPFTIHQDVYADALRLTMRGFYGQRCGCTVNLGGGYQHPPCHLKDAFDPTSGRTGATTNTGGWHDAGDYGRYSVNSGISTATLLWAWELFPDALHTLALDIPESGRGLPDFLAEIQWNLNWMLSMQDPSDGGVWHKQSSLAFCGFVMPQDDTMTSEIIGTGSAPYKNTCATADLAAVMAIAARCFAPYDAAFSDRCLAASIHAWDWSRKNPSVLYTNPTTVTTGEYGDKDCSDELLWASAELFRTTHEPQYEAAALAAIQPLLPGLSISTPSWNNLSSMALWTYALAVAEHPADAHPNPSRTSTVTAIHTTTRTAAASLVQSSQRNGYGNTLSLADYHWGSNSNAGNQSLLLILADRFRPDQQLFDAALSNLHYILGRNCFGVSWVTQLGQRPFMHPHHRPSIADGIVAPWPGLLSGGPNAFGGDAIADALPKAPPMRMWIDNDRAYSMNEIAINWNAPLVFLLAAANSERI